MRVEQKLNELLDSQSKELLKVNKYIIVFFSNQSFSISSYLICKAESNDRYASAQLKQRRNLRYFQLRIIFYFNALPNKK